MTGWIVATATTAALGLAGGGDPGARHRAIGGLGT